MPLVAVPGHCKGQEGSEYVGWRDQALCLADAEAHALLEDDGQEIGDGVGAGGREAEEGCEAPDLEVQSVPEVLAPVELGGNGVVAIFLNAGYDEGGFFLGEETETS